MLTVFLHFIIAFSSSIVGALSGIGGGIIIKPVLDTFGFFQIATITFLSGCTVLSMSGVSLVLVRRSSVSIDYRVGGFLAASAVAGGILGKLLFNMSLRAADNPENIQIIQASILIILTLAVLIFTFFKNRIRTYRFRNVFVCIGIGLFLGLAGAFLGIGGGPINLLVLNLFFSMDSKTAAINSLFIIFFSQLASLFLTVFSGNIPDFSLPVLAFMAAGGISGALTGSFISGRITNRGVDKLFMVVLVVIIGLCVRNIML